MSFQPKPFHWSFCWVRRSKVQVRPTARGIDQGSTFKFSHRSCDQKWTRSGDSLCDNLLSAINPTSFC